MLSSGIPTREKYLRLESEPIYGELLNFSREFERQCQIGQGSAKSYSNKWVADPFQQWSRRWEYVYVAQRLSEWVASRSGPLKVVDAGSGFTFFPFYLAQANTNLAIDCYDNDPTAGGALQEATDILGTGPAFKIEDLENLSQDEASVDAVYSVSVIEHTQNPRQVIDEINRVLKPGGIFVCTFDVSFEARSPMHVRHVEQLVDHINRVFDRSADWKPVPFESLPSDNNIVTTQWDSDVVKAGLPWRNPLLIWFYDMLRGRYRSTLHRPMTFCCQTITKKKS
jgi:SAM-dependent methyltransferase